MTPYGDTDLGQLWLRQWLVAWRHQAITWTNVDLSSIRSSDIHLTATSQDRHQPSITKIHLKIINQKFCSNITGANELIVPMEPCLELFYSSFVGGIDLLHHGAVQFYNLTYQCHGYWWLGDIRSQGISRNGTDQVWKENSIVHMARINLLTSAYDTF